MRGGVRGKVLLSNREPRAESRGSTLVLGAGRFFWCQACGRSRADPLSPRDFGWSHGLFGSSDSQPAAKSCGRDRVGKLGT